MRPNKAQIAEYARTIAAVARAYGFNVPFATMVWLLAVYSGEQA